MRLADLSRRATTPSPAARVLVASSAMLAFISFWRVAAIVLNDMGSSAFYAGAISEHFVGKTAPWFVLAIMLLAGTVAALYIESCGMFVRGGVYRVVKEAMGSTLAKFSVSARDLLPAVGLWAHSRSRRGRHTIRCLAKKWQSKISQSEDAMFE